MGTQRVLAHTLAQLAEHLEVTIQDLFPSTKAPEINNDEGETIAKELNRELKIPARRAEQIVRKLVGGPGRS